MLWKMRHNIPDEIFQESGKQDSLKHYMNSWAHTFHMKSSGSHFFRTTTTIQSGPEVFDKSRLVMTFFTNLGVTWILSSSRLVLERQVHKVARVITNQFFRKVFIKRFCFIKSWEQHFRSVKNLLIVSQKSREPHFW